MKKLLLILLGLYCLPGFSQSKFEVFFDFNKDEPSHESGIHLRNWINANSNAEVSGIFGYCDSIDDEQYNRELALRRIHSVVAILKENDIKITDKAELSPFGEEFEQSPVQAENRKVTIFYTLAVPEKEVIPALNDLVKDAKPGDIIRLREMNFYNRSANMLPRSKPILEELLCILKENPNLKIEIQGHICCQQGNDPEGISTARARAVYVHLLRNGIDKKRLSYKGYGSSRPLHPLPEQSDKEEEDNRRVEIRIVER